MYSRLVGNQGILKSVEFCFISILITLSPLACTQPAEKDLKIGVITPLTGEGATYGDATRKGLDLAASQINSAGGINGKEITLVYEDDQIKPEVGVNAIRKLINIDKVPVIIGAFGSSVTLAIAPIAEQNKVVLFSASSTADAISNSGDYIFRNVPTNSAQGKSAAEFATNQLKAKKAAILYMNNDYGVSLRDSFERKFKEMGGQVSIADNYNSGDSDFKAQLSKIKAFSPDVIFFPGHYQESGLILKQGKELAIKAKFIGGDGSYSPDLIKVAGNAAEGSFYTIMAMGFGVADAEIEKFRVAFVQRFKHEPDVYSAYVYDALNIIAAAIQARGYSSEGIKNGLYTLANFKGVTGVTKFDKDGEVAKPFYIYRVVNGQFKPIDGRSIK